MHRLYALGLLLCLSSVSARLSIARLKMPPSPPPESTGTLAVVSPNGTILPHFNTTYYFDQLIDHNNPSLGTFKQRYWHTAEFYKPGKPLHILTSHFLTIHYSQVDLSFWIPQVKPTQMVWVCALSLHVVMFKFQISGYYTGLGNKSMLGLIGSLLFFTHKKPMT